MPVKKPKVFWDVKVGNKEAKRITFEVTSISMQYIHETYSYLMTYAPELLTTSASSAKEHLRELKGII